MEQPSDVIPNGQKWDLLWRRSLAIFVDRLFVWPLLLVFIFLANAIMPNADHNLNVSLWKWKQEANGVLAITFSFLYGLPRLDWTAIIAVWVVISVARHGRTPGMEACSLRLQQIGGSTAGWKQILLWHVASYLSAAALGIGYLWILFDPRGRTWHDIIAGVNVLRHSEERG